jgi:hypothetical protein
VETALEEFTKDPLWVVIDHHVHGRVMVAIHGPATGWAAKVLVDTQFNEAMGAAPSPVFTDAEVAAMKGKI